VKKSVFVLKQSILQKFELKSMGQYHKQSLLVAYKCNKLSWLILKTKQCNFKIQ